MLDSRVLFDFLVTNVTKPPVASLSDAGKRRHTIGRRDFFFVAIGDVATSRVNLLDLASDTDGRAVHSSENYCFDAADGGGEAVVRAGSCFCSACKRGDVAACEHGMVAPYRPQRVLLRFGVEGPGAATTRRSQEAAYKYLDDEAVKLLRRASAGSHVMSAWGSGKKEDLRPVQLVTGEVVTGAEGVPAGVRSVEVYYTQCGSYEVDVPVGADGDTGRYKLWCEDVCAAEYLDCGPGAARPCYKRHTRHIPISELRAPVDFRMVAAGRIRAGGGQPAAHRLALPPGTLQATMAACAAGEQRFDGAILYRQRST